MFRETVKSFRRFLVIPMTAVMGLGLALALRPVPSSAQEPAAGVTDANAAQARTVAELEQAVERYFSSWSNRDMETYGACFLREAVIHHISDRGEVTRHDLAPFLQWQRQAVRRANPPLIETAERTEITLEANLARALVYWKLTAGSRVEYGYDHFTFVRQNGEWKIVSLIFYGAPPPSSAK